MDVRHFSCWLRTTSHPPCGFLLRSVLLVREWFRRLFADLPRRESQPDPSQSVCTFWWIKWLSDILFLLRVPEYFGCPPPPIFIPPVVPNHTQFTWHRKRRVPFNFIHRTFHACATNSKFGCARSIFKGILLWEQCDSYYLDYNARDFDETSYAALCTHVLETM